ncbi:hypothetical protein O6H91_09G098200 [Diphasiastrum complanatum]|uniref:Uncharacterized protein n=2 Tax=Diphasiastrum complanatum TaxID=34168 RepID=A0ACC2CSG8_DIPCM|nr:hypothetical protein O6H91_09G098200 [Diphasiastrum complanatum]
MDPIEACSALSLVGDMLPVEQPMLCMNEMRLQYANKSLAVGTIFGVGTTPEVDWHLQSSYVEKFLRALFPHLDQLADMILHFAPTTCGILQDMVKTLVVRVACRHAGYARILLHPMLAFIKEHTAISSVPSDFENFQIEHFLQFISGLMSHPATKLVLMREGIMDLFQHALGLESSAFPEHNLLNKADVLQSRSTRCKWILRSFLAVYDPKAACHPLSPLNSCVLENYPTFEECCRMVSTILDLVEVMPFTKDMVILVELFEKIASHKLGRAAFADVALRLNTEAQVEAMDGEMLNDSEKIPTSQVESEESPHHYDPNKSKTPLLNLWKRLAVQVEMDKLNNSTLVDIVQRFALVAISLAAAGRSAYGLGALKLLFGLDITNERENDSISESLEFIVSVVDTLSYGLESTPASVIAGADPFVPLPNVPSVQAYAAVMSMLRLLKKPANFSQLREKLEALVDNSTLECPSVEAEQSKQLPSTTRVMPVISSMCARRCDVDFEKGDEKLQQAGEIPLHTESRDMLVWECCTIIPERPIVSTASKRRLSLSGETGSKRHRVDGNTGIAAESSSNTGTGTGSNLRIGSASGATAGLPNRRDSFRQRKPNTSRPPSMHVDDYVARERGSDAVTTGSGNTVPNSIQRNSSSSGRPPSIHVDEFMARQRERQHSLGAVHSTSSQHLLSSIGADSAVSKGVDASLKLSKHENDKESSFDAGAHNLHMVQSNIHQVGNLTATVGLSGSDIPGVPSLSGEDSGKIAQKGGSGPAKTHGHHVSISMISSAPGSFVGMNEEFDNLYPGFDFFEKDSLEPSAATDFESPSSKVLEEPQQTLRSIAMRHQKSIASRAKLTEPALTAKGPMGPAGPLPVKSSSPVSLEMRTTVPTVGTPSQSSGGVEKPHFLTSVTSWMSSAHSISEAGTLTKQTEDISSLPYTSSSMQVSVPQPPPPSLGMMVLPSPPKEQRISHMMALPDSLLQPREHKATPDIAMLPKITTGNVFTPLAGDQRLLSAPLPLEAFENQRSLKPLTMQLSTLDRGFPTEIRSDKMIRASLPPAPPLPPPLPPLPPPSTGWLSVDAHIYRPDRPLPITSVTVPSISISSVIHATLASSINQQLSSDRSLGVVQSSALGSANSRLFEDSGPTSRGSVRPPHFPPLPPLSSPPLIQNAVQTSTHMPLPVSTIFPYAGGSMPVESRPAYGVSSSAPQPPVERVTSFPFSLPSQNPAVQSFSLPAPFIPPVPAGRPTSPYSSFPSTATGPQLQQQQQQLQSPLSVQQLQPQQFQQQNQQQLLQQATQSSLLLSPQQQAAKLDAVQSPFQQQQHQILQPQEKFQLPQMFLQQQQLPQPQQVRSHHHQQPILQEQLHSQQQPPQEQRPQETGSSLHSLQQMLASPDAIQELLKDQSKLRQLLEQHPKLISLLQEKLSQGSSS